MTGRFLSTPSARRATRKCSRSRSYFPHFYPRPPRGGRQNSELTHKGYKTFLSTPSARRATGKRYAQCGADRDFYPRPPRGGRRPAQQGRQHVKLDFYPRPPRGGRLFWLFLFRFRRDFYPRPPRGGRLGCIVGDEEAASISIHALREEGDRFVEFFIGKLAEFLSTPSARRATSMTCST